MVDPPITDGRADELTDWHGELAMRAALNLSPALRKERLVAIADFIFNLGTTRYKASTLRRAINAEDWDRAEEEIVKWVYGGGRKLPGLVKRRAFEAMLLRME